MKLICANFKMNLTSRVLKIYLDEVSGKIKDNVVFFPSVLYLSMFKERGYTVGSQDISFKEFGSLTGDLSVTQLKEFGIDYTIIGHSERREFYNDSKYVKNKVKLALTNNLKTVLCIGENLKEFEEGETLDILKKELDTALKSNLKYITNDNLIIAYEPIWAIGTGKIPTNKILTDTIKEIKDYLQENYNLKLKVLYGGSVNLENIRELEKIPSIDGYLIGGASLNPDKFLSLINKVN